MLPKPTTDKRVSLIVGMIFAVCVALVGITMATLLISDNNISVRDMAITNVTDTAFSVTWVSDEPYVGGIVFQDNDNWPLLFAQSGKSVIFDDRDVELDSQGVYRQVDSGVKTRYTHHVTLRGLKPETQYFFRVTGRMNGKVGDIKSATTQKLREDLKTPDPGYGKIEGQELPADDGLIVLTAAGKENEGSPKLFSTTLSSNNTYSIDMNPILEDIRPEELSLRGAIKISNSIRTVHNYQNPKQYKPLETVLVINQKSEPVGDHFLQRLGKISAAGQIGSCDDLLAKYSEDFDRFYNPEGENKIALDLKVGELFTATADAPYRSSSSDQNVILQGCSGDNYQFKLRGDLAVIYSATPGQIESIIYPAVPNGSGSAQTCLEVGSFVRPNSNLNLRSSAGTSSNVLRVLNPINNLRVIGCSPDQPDGYVWVNVELQGAAGVNGYVAKNFLVTSSEQTQAPTPSINEPVFPYANTQDNSPQNGESVENFLIRLCSNNFNLVSSGPRDVDTLRGLFKVEEKRTFTQPVEGYERLGIIRVGSLNNTEYVCSGRIDQTVETASVQPENSQENAITSLRGYSVVMGNSLYREFTSANAGSDTSCRQRIADVSKVLGLDGQTTLGVVLRIEPQSEVLAGFNQSTDVIFRQVQFASGGFYYCVARVQNPEVINNQAGGNPGLVDVAVSNTAVDPREAINQATRNDLSSISEEDLCQTNRLYIPLGINLRFAKGATPEGTLLDSIVDYDFEMKDMANSRICLRERGQEYEPVRECLPTFDAVDNICKKNASSIDYKRVITASDSISPTILASSPTAPEAIRGKVLGAGTDQRLELSESGRYAFFTNGERIAEQDIVVKDGQVQVRLFNDDNGNGVKDATESYFADYTQITFAKEATAEGYALTSGWNLIHLPLIDTRTDGNVSKASDLIDYWNGQGADIKHVARFRGGNFQIFSKRESGTEFAQDFDLIPGEGLFVLNLGTNVNVTFSGNRFESSVPVKLNQGWNLVGIMAPGKSYNSEQSLVSMKSQGFSADTISQFEGGTYQSVISKDGTIFGNNFNITDKRGYFVRVETGGGTNYDPGK